MVIMDLHNQASVDAGTPHFKSNSSLGDLPAEIWLQILRCLLIKRPEQRDGDTLVVISPLSDWTGRDSSNNRLSSQVLRTNRANHTTGVEILYGENVFEMNGDDVWVFPNFLSDIGRSNVSRLRHLRLDHRNAGYVDCRGAPHNHRQGLVYVNAWGRDLWLDRLFDSFLSLRRLETLSIAVDLPSWKMRDAVAHMETRWYFEESGLIDKLRAAKQLRDEVEFRDLYDQVVFYINKLGISRAATSLADDWFPQLSAHVYYGSGPDGAYGIFSTKELETFTPAEKQRTAAQLLVVSFHDVQPGLGVFDLIQIRKLQFDLKKREVVEMQ
jgi:hypothetical protein